MPIDFDDFNPNNPYTAIALLGERVNNLGKEKEQLESKLERECALREAHEKDVEERIAKMEKSFQRGAGIIMVLPILGTVIGILLAYGKAIFAPWTGSK